MHLTQHAVQPGIRSGSAKIEHKGCRSRRKRREMTVCEARYSEAMVSEQYTL